MIPRILVAFLILTALLTGALVYNYYIRRSLILSEGFSEEDISTAEQTISEALPQLDQATIARVLKIIQRIAGTVLQPSFFTDAIRRSGMSPIDMARDYMNSQKAKS